MSRIGDLEDEVERLGFEMRQSQKEAMDLIREQAAAAKTLVDGLRPLISELRDIGDRLAVVEERLGIRRE
jgi:hypothetical protein